MENRDTGLLLDRDNLSLQRSYFEEMVSLLGINVTYIIPRLSKTYSLNGEIETKELGKVDCGCIFEEHPTAKTTRKLGWNTEKQESSSLISVPYDLKGLEVGGLFLIPSPFDNTKRRLFRVVSLSGTMIYPASISCEIVPEYLDNFDQGQLQTSPDNATPLLRDGEYDQDGSGFMLLKEDDREDLLK